jgi:hypothetical protein
MGTEPIRHLPETSNLRTSHPSSGRITKSPANSALSAALRFGDPEHLVRRKAQVVAPGFRLLATYPIERLVDAVAPQ